MYVRESSYCISPNMLGRTVTQHQQKAGFMLAFTSPVAQTVIGELASGRNWQNVQIGKSIVKKYIYYTKFES